MMAYEINDFCAEIRIGDVVTIYPLYAKCSSLKAYDSETIIKNSREDLINYEKMGHTLSVGKVVDIYRYEGDIVGSMVFYVINLYYPNVTKKNQELDENLAFKVHFYRKEEFIKGNYRGISKFEDKNDD